MAMEHLPFMDDLLIFRLWKNFLAMEVFLAGKLIELGDFMGCSTKLCVMTKHDQPLGIL